MMNERAPRALWIDGIIGASGFAVAHLVVFLGWRDWFAGGAYPPWFLNSGRAAAFTAIWLFLGAVAIRLSRPGAAAWSSAAAVAAGAVVASIIVLFAVGPGNLFPIVIAVGALTVFASVFAGWGTARFLR